MDINEFCIKRSFVKGTCHGISLKIFFCYQIECFHKTVPEIPMLSIQIFFRATNGFVMHLHIQRVFFGHQHICVYDSNIKTMFSNSFLLTSSNMMSLLTFLAHFSQTIRTKLLILMNRFFTISRVRFQCI